MKLLIDIGNTRTKWALADDKNQLSSQGFCLNADIAHANLPTKNVQKAFISNVAGLEMAHQIKKVLTPIDVQFLQVTKNAYGLKNNYEPTLGVDRWAALVAAWHSYHQPIVVVNAGTAITIDALAPSNNISKINSDATFIGGAIMPGLGLMHQSLKNNAALLKLEMGSWQEFPTNTSDAIKTGVINAVVGAINLTLKRLEKQCGHAPLLLLSGGDAHTIAEAMCAQISNLDTKQGIITENIVLQGLVLLAKA